MEDMAPSTPAAPELAIEEFVEYQASGQPGFTSYVAALFIRVCGVPGGWQDCTTGPPLWQFTMQACFSAQSNVARRGWISMQA